MLRATWRPLIFALAANAAAIGLHWVFQPLAVIFTLDVVLCACSYRRSRGRPLEVAYLRHAQRTWCARGVAIAVWGDLARIYFRALGYRPWHVLPNGFPLVLFRRSFWATFFQPLM